MRKSNFYPPFCKLTLLMITLSLGTAAWSSEKVIFDFTEKNNAGTNPEANVIADAAGNLYGTTFFASGKYKGVVYKLTPGSNGSWAESVLYTFDGGADGAAPTSIVLDASGNLFGITSEGGRASTGTKPCMTVGCGVVYELKRGSGGYTYSLLYTFTGLEDGSGPAGITLDPSGNLYITTIAATGNCGGGTCGAVFKLTHTAGTWKGSSVHVFGAGDGENPRAPVLLDAAGNLYGTTQRGGTYGFGTVYEISPASGGHWTESVLYSFTGGSDGSQPQSSLVFDSANLLGTTVVGGANSYGTVFQLTPSSGSWTESVLYSFADGSDGSEPAGGLTLDPAGNVYGTTISGGGSTVCYPVGCGTVWKLAPVSGGWTESVLYAFSGGTDGQEPQPGGVILEKGNLYGTASYGGKVEINGCPNGCGVVFEVTP
jgi:uncharacterized repeat protein (TIGR03803 family)